MAGVQRTTRMMKKKKMREVTIEPELTFV